MREIFLRVSDYDRPRHEPRFRALGSLGSPRETTPLRSSGHHNDITMTVSSTADFKTVFFLFLAERFFLWHAFKQARFFNTITPV